MASTLSPLIAGFRSVAMTTSHRSVPWHAPAGPLSPAMTFCQPVPASALAPGARREAIISARLCTGGDNAAMPILEVLICAAAMPWLRWLRHENAASVCVGS